VVTRQHRHMARRSSTHAAFLAAVSRRERITIASITIAFTLVLVLWAVLTPALGAPDEINHFDAAIQLALGRGWPDPAHLHFLNASLELKTTGAQVIASARPSVEALMASNPGSGSVNQMSQHPPTWYALAAGVLRLIGFEHHRWDVALLALRLMNVAMLAALPLVIWATVRTVTRSPRAAVIGAMAVFLIPQIAFNGASVNNDPPVVILGAVATWLVCRMFAGDGSWRTFSILVLTTSAAVAFKATALPVVPFVVIAVLVATPGRAKWTRGAIALVTPVVLTSWWWVKNFLLFHTLQPGGLPSSIKHVPFKPGTGPNIGTFLNTEWTRVTNSFWGQYGPLAYPSSPIVIAALTVTTLGVLIVWGFRRGAHRSYAWTLAVLPLIALATGLQNNWSTYLRTTGMGGIQGRYYFVAVAALAALSAIAWRQFLPAADSRRKVGAVVIVSSATMTIYGLTVAYRGYYEASQFKISGEGLHMLRNLTMVGAAPLGVVAVFALVALIAAAGLAVNFVTQGRRENEASTDLATT
jgi:4-amino-4-deoxy-L-arabinose transferase-like glycosyltransferase